MMMRLPILMMVAASFCSFGCMHKQVARDGIGSRQAVLDVYTDQIMDNVIRARRGLPFVQLVYRDILVQDVDSINAGVSDTIGSSTDQSLGAAGLVTGTVRKWSNSLLPTAGAKRDRTISFHADPVTDKNDIYEYYMAFACDPTLLVESDAEPKCSVHISRRWKDKWYYVPCEAAGVFLQLSLKTTFMRGPEKTPGPDYFEASIRDVVTEIDPAKPMVVFGVVTFDRNIKNDDGFMMVTTADKKKVRIDLFRYTKPIPPATTVKALGDDTNAFSVAWTLANANVTAAELRNAKAKIYLQNYFPPPPPPVADLQRLNDNLDQIRLNQLNQSNK